MKEGTKVVCKGRFSHEFSLTGTIESVLLSHEYGIRLSNGNYVVLPRENVKEVRESTT